MKFSHTPNQQLPNVTAVCSKDKKQATLQHPHLDIELGELQATSKFAAVRIPVDVEKGDTSGPVDPKAVQSAMRTKAAGLKVGKTQHPKGLEEFPALTELWPTAKEIKNGFRVAFNAKFLLEVAEAIGAKNGAVELIFPTADGNPSALAPVLVQPMVKAEQGEEFGVEIEPRDGDGVALPEGLLMPIRFVGAPVASTKAKASTRAKAASSAADEGLSPAQKAARTRRERAAANGNGSNGNGSKKPATNGQSEIPYAGIPVEKLTAGQKAARTKALKAAGLTEPPATNGKKNGNGKGDLSAALKQAVKAASKGAKAPKATATKSSSAAKRATSNGKPRWTPEQLRDRALKAAETRRQKLAAASK